MTHKGDEIIITDPEHPRYGQRGLIASDTHEVQFSDDQGATLTLPEKVRNNQMREAEA